MSRSKARDRRVTLALKWHYLDNLEVDEIRERFEREGYGSYKEPTIRGYLNESPKEEVVEQIEKEQANVRLQIAEREEQMYQRAREAEGEATEDEPIVRVVPVTARVPLDRDVPLTLPDWEILDEDDEDYPNWAKERDTVIRFVEGKREVHPGDYYPVQGIDGEPKYEKEFAGLERDQPDLVAQAQARREQSQHLESKGRILGEYEKTVNLNHGGEVEHTVELDEDTAQAIRKATLQEDTDDE